QDLAARRFRPAARRRDQPGVRRLRRLHRRLPRTRRRHHAGRRAAQLERMAGTRLVSQSKRPATPKLCGMKVGIDFGTTHTVVAVVDRGNYPVVSFDGVDAWPSIIAANESGELRYGPDAASVRHDPHWSVLRSFKRLLNDAGPTTTVDLAGRRYLLADLFAGFLTQFRSDLQH